MLLLEFHYVLMFFDFQNIKAISTEELMKTATALHAKHILTNVKEVLATLPIFPPSTITLVTSDNDSFQSHLTIQLTPTRSLKIQIEPITGRFALQKPSAMITQAERAMNGAKPEDWTVIVDQIVRARFLSMQEEIETRARSLGWEIMKINVERQILKQWFGPTTRYLTFMRRKSWKKNWIVVVVLGDLGETWWVAEM